MATGWSHLPQGDIQKPDVLMEETVAHCLFPMAHSANKSRFLKSKMLLVTLEAKKNQTAQMSWGIPAERWAQPIHVWICACADGSQPWRSRVIQCICLYCAGIHMPSER